MKSTASDPGLKLPSYIFTVVDEKKNNDFTFIAVSLKTSHAVYQLHY